MRDGWEMVKLGSMMSPVRRKANVVPHEKYMLITLPVRGVGARLRKIVLGSELGTAKYEVRTDDLMISKIDARKGSNSLLPSALSGGIVTGDFLSYSLDPAIVSPGLMDIIVRRPEFSWLCDTVSSGTTNRVRLDPTRFLNLRLPLPPLLEQRRIVDLIGAVDVAIEAAEKVASCADRLWWNVSKHVGETQAVEEFTVLADIAQIGTGLAKNKKLADEVGAVEYNFLRAANVQRRYIDLSDVHKIHITPARANRAMLVKGDILMNEGGDRDKLGRGAVWSGEIENCVHQNHVFSVRVTDQGYSPSFISAWTNSFGQSWFDMVASQTTGIASISKTTLGKLPIPIVSLAQQTTWAEALTGAWDAHLAARAHANSLRDLRSNMLTVLLSGEHEVPASYDKFLKEEVAV